MNLILVIILHLYWYIFRNGINKKIMNATNVGINLKYNCILVSKLMLHQDLYDSDSYSHLVNVVNILFYVKGHIYLFRLFVIFLKNQPLVYS